LLVIIVMNTKNIKCRLHSHLFVNARRKTIGTRVKVNTIHNWNVRRGRRPNLIMKMNSEKVSCVESIGLISVCSHEMAEERQPEDW
jgi:hypothetical protein